MQEAAANTTIELTRGGASRQGRRPYQEDAFSPGAPPTLSRPYGDLFIVVDGVGGQQAGSLAAQIATAAMQEAYYALRQAGTEIMPALKQAVEQANTAVYKEAKNQGISRMGATVVAAVIDSGQVYVVNVGDARAYLAANGQLQRLTNDHSWVEEQVLAGNLSEEDARHHELRNIVTRVMGNNPSVEVEIYAPRPFRRSDTLLLCSDGLYDVLETNQLLILLTRSPAPIAAEDLVREAYDAGSQDNITAVAVAGQPEPDSLADVGIAGVGTGANNQRRMRQIALVALGLLALLLFFVFMMSRSKGTRESGAESLLTILTPAATVPMSTDMPLQTTSPPPDPTAPEAETVDAQDAAADTSAVPVPDSSGDFMCVRDKTILFWRKSVFDTHGNICVGTNDTLEKFGNVRGFRLLSNPEQPETMVGQLGGYACGFVNMLRIVIELDDDSSIEGWVNAQTPYDLVNDPDECP